MWDGNRTNSVSTARSRRLVSTPSFSPPRRSASKSSTRGASGLATRIPTDLHPRLRSARDARSPPGNGFCAAYRFFFQHRLEPVRKLASARGTPSSPLLQGLYASVDPVSTFCEARRRTTGFLSEANDRVARDHPGACAALAVCGSS